MAKATIVYFRQKSGRVPLLDWLRNRRYHSDKSRELCLATIEALSMSDRRDVGYPSVKHLRGDIYELRIRYDKICYRIFFSYEKENIIFLTHGFVKKTDKTPSREIAAAMLYLKQYRKNKNLHSQVGGNYVR